MLIKKTGKKFLALFLGLTLCLFLSACNNGENQELNKENTSSTITAENNSSEANTSSKESSVSSKNTSSKTTSKSKTTASNSKTTSKKTTTNVTSKVAATNSKVSNTSSKSTASAATSSKAPANQKMTIAEYLDSEEFQSEFGELKEFYDEDFMEIDIYARNNSMVISCTFLFDVEPDMVEFLEESLEYQSEDFKQILKEAKNDVIIDSIIVEYLDMDGNVIVSREFK